MFYSAVFTLFLTTPHVSALVRDLRPTLYNGIECDVYT